MRPLHRQDDLAEIVALYKRTADRPPHNLQPRYNVCPTDLIDVVTERDGKRDLVRMRWGLVPRWWSKPTKSCGRQLSTPERRPSRRSRFFAKRSNARDA